jgi:hypothetical protein
MAGLNSILSNTENTTLTLPKWYDAAQQGVVNASLAQAQAPGQAQQFATSTFAPGATNPFTSAASTLQTIGSGAANPWNVATDAAGKQTVTPNVSTPLGGLFSAQTDYLNKMMPDITAPAEAQGISSGGFGGSQQRYGVQKARAGALADLFQKQMTEALASQQTGVSAASSLGTVGGQGVKSALDTANFPTTQLSNVANVLNAAKPGTTTTRQTELAPLSQVGSLLTMIGGGSNIMDSVYGTPAVGTPNTPGYKPAVQGIPGLQSLLGALGIGRTPTTPTTPTTGDVEFPLHPSYGPVRGYAADGTPWYTNSSGESVYANGDPYVVPKTGMGVGGDPLFDSPISGGYVYEDESPYGSDWNTAAADSDDSWY